MSDAPRVVPAVPPDVAIRAEPRAVLVAAEPTAFKTVLVNLGEANLQAEYRCVGWSRPTNIDTWQDPGSAWVKLRVQSSSTGLRDTQKD